MDGSIPELNYLLKQVEVRFDHKLETTTDFESLSAAIEDAVHEMISTSTLKRLWGYVTSHPVPRIATLDVLSRYVGERDFKAFCASARASGGLESEYFNHKFILASDVEVGGRLRIGWNPNRQVELEYLDNGRWKVISSMNSKLAAGDCFECSSFIIGCPLFIPGIERDGGVTPPYVAGSRDGITFLDLV